MSHSAVQFGPFRLDFADRRLSRGGETIQINTRYMDALILLVGASGALVGKERFMDEVWRGVPVTDEALTQAIRTLRRTLGDSVGKSQFIETVPKHGYRFIAAVEAAQDCAEEVAPLVESRRKFIRSTLAGTGGAMLAGAAVGLLYGFIGAAQSPAAGAVSLVLVLVLVSVFSSGIAGAGIAAGVAASNLVQPLRWQWMIAGGSLGGLTVGAFANLIGQDAFRLLLGHSVGDFAGPFEGLVLGGAVGLAVYLARGGLWRSLIIGGLIGAGAGLLIALLDGRLMAGSLQALVTAFPTSQFGFDELGRTVGEKGIGPLGSAITAGIEGAVFTTGIVFASRRR